MKIENLAEYINKRLKKYSLAYAIYEKGIFTSKVMVYHSDNISRQIEIRKYFRTYTLTLNDKGWDEVYMEVYDLGKSNDYLIEIVDFVNNHTIHETPE